MKELTNSLRALADLLDRPEFEGVPFTDYVDYDMIEWDNGLDHPLNKQLLAVKVFPDGDADYWASNRIPRTRFNPKAPTLPADLLRELERLRR